MKPLMWYCEVLSVSFCNQLTSHSSAELWIIIVNISCSSFSKTKWTFGLQPAASWNIIQEHAGWCSTPNRIVWCAQVHSVEQESISLVHTFLFSYLFFSPVVGTSWYLLWIRCSILLVASLCYLFTCLTAYCSSASSAFNNSSLHWYQTVLQVILLL